MKAPSKNFAASVRGQSIPGRAPLAIQTGMVTGNPTMTVPGEGGVEQPPGNMHERSAAHFAAPQSKGAGA